MDDKPVDLMAAILRLADPRVKGRAEVRIGRGRG